ncbi:MAG: acetyl-CoA carboxylase biotin carboxyl carrier protein subunit [Armatimonadetes bacterium CP1_7O]|nr:MAG: acetyl-CoA carboxylase biotin carboxyl carrier protein subunit [Armatimonadetes bacterium CP1_7O]
MALPIETVERCLQLMSHYHLQELEIAAEGVRIHIERADAPVIPAVAAVQPPQPPAAETPNWVPIESPMTGMFYRGPSPSEPPYVEEGDLVYEGQTIGLIEAMKVFNEIPAPMTGVVRRIVAQNASLVQQGEVLMLLEPPE